MATRVCLATLALLLMFFAAQLPSSDGVTNDAKVTLKDVFTFKRTNYAIGETGVSIDLDLFLIYNVALNMTQGRTDASAGASDDLEMSMKAGSFEGFIVLSFGGGKGEQFYSGVYPFRFTNHTGGDEPPKPYAGLGGEQSYRVVDSLGAFKVGASLVDIEYLQISIDNAAVNTELKIDGPAVLDTKQQWPKPQAIKIPVKVTEAKDVNIRLKETSYDLTIAMFIMGRVDGIKRIIEVEPTERTAFSGFRKILLDDASFLMASYKVRPQAETKTVTVTITTATTSLVTVTAIPSATTITSTVSSILTQSAAPQAIDFTTTSLVVAPLVVIIVAVSALYFRARRR